MSSAFESSLASVDPASPAEAAWRARWNDPQRAGCRLARPRALVRSRAVCGARTRTRREEKEAHTQRVWRQRAKITAGREQVEQRPPDECVRTAFDGVRDAETMLACNACWCDLDSGSAYIAACDHVFCACERRVCSRPRPFRLRFYSNTSLARSARTARVRRI